MLKSILIGIDDSKSCLAAQALAIGWAKRFNVPLVGMSVVDERPGERILTPVTYRRGSPYPVGQRSVGDGHPRSHDSLRESKNHFGLTCFQAGVDFKMLDEFGLAHLRILLESQEHDIILLGQECQFGEDLEGEAGETIAMVLRDTPRPVVVVPAISVGGERIVIAYDGSLQASRTLAAFEASGLGQGREVHIVSAFPERRLSELRSRRAYTFLRKHEIEATLHAIETTQSPAHAILDLLRDLSAGLLVMGAYGQPILREVFLGSVTRTMLKECPAPVFCFH